VYIFTQCENCEIKAEVPVTSTVLQEGISSVIVFVSLCIVLKCILPRAVILKLHHTNPNNNQNENIDKG
jgi:hypothetical protein